MLFACLSEALSLLVHTVSMRSDGQQADTSCMPHEYALYCWKVIQIAADGQACCVAYYQSMPHSGKQAVRSIFSTQAMLVDHVQHVILCHVCHGLQGFWISSLLPAMQPLVRQVHHVRASYLLMECMQVSKDTQHCVTFK